MLPNLGAEELLGCLYCCSCPIPCRCLWGQGEQGSRAGGGCDTLYALGHLVLTSLGELCWPTGCCDRLCCCLLWFEAASPRDGDQEGSQIPLLAARAEAAEAEPELRLLKPPGFVWQLIRGQSLSAELQPRRAGCDGSQCKSCFQ